MRLLLRARRDGVKPGRIDIQPSRDSNALTVPAVYDVYDLIFTHKFGQKRGATRAVGNGGEFERSEKSEVSWGQIAALQFSETVRPFLVSHGTEIRD